jgi:hypothetical protein
MKSVGFDRLLTLTALGVVLMLSSHPGMAQQSGQQKADTAVPMPDTSLPPPLTAKDVAGAGSQIAPAELIRAEPKQEAAPVSELVKPDTAPPPAEPVKAEPNQDAAAPAAQRTTAASPPSTTPASDTTDSAVSEKQIDAAVPVPDTSLPPPLTAKDVETPAKQAAPVDIVNDQSKQNAAAPSAEPAKAAAAPVATADSAVADKLRELINSKQFERFVSHKADRAGIEAFYSSHNYAPLWVSSNAGNDRAKAAITYLGAGRCSWPRSERLPDSRS